MFLNGTCFIYLSTVIEQNLNYTKNINIFYLYIFEKIDFLCLKSDFFCISTSIYYLQISSVMCLPVLGGHKTEDIWDYEGKIQGRKNGYFHVLHFKSLFWNLSVLWWVFANVFSREPSPTPKKTLTDSMWINSFSGNVKKIHGLHLE